MRLASTVGAVVLALAMAGCTEVRSGQLATSTERSAAQDLATQLDALASGPSASGELLRVIDVQPLLALIAQPGFSPMPVAALLNDRSIERELGDCVIATSTSATFTECAIGNHFVEGTWSLQNQLVHSELVDVFMAGPEEHGSVSLTANLTRRGGGAGSSGLSGTLSGTVDIGITWTADSTDHVLDASIRVDNLTTDEPGCLTGGTIAITGKLGDATFGELALGSASLWFGPGCQDVQIAR